MAKRKCASGYFVDFRGAKIGKITTFGSSVSTACSMHARCRLPAITIRKLSGLERGDECLMNWLLLGVTHAGERRLTAEEHMAQKPF